jgi:hypothetical protein
MLAGSTRVRLTLIAALITGLVALVALNTPVEAAHPPWVKSHHRSYDNYPPRESLFVRGTLLQDSKDGSYMNWYYYDFIPFRAVDVITLPRLLPTRSNWLAVLGGWGSPNRAQASG